MSRSFEIRPTEGRVTILHLTGHLDGQVEGQLIESARQVQGSGGRFLLLDLGRLEMLTSAGLRALHTIYKALTPQEEHDAWHKEHTGKVFKSPYFKLAGASPQVHYVLSISGFLQNIPIFPDLQSALDSFPA